MDWKRNPRKAAKPPRTVTSTEDVRSFSHDAARECCPAGASFSERSLGKSVYYYSREPSRPAKIPGFAISHQPSALSSALVFGRLAPLAERETSERPQEADRHRETRFRKLNAES